MMNQGSPESKPPPDDEPVPDLVCATCLEPLQAVSRADRPRERTWTHSIAGQARDHTPDPIPRADAPRTRNKCDFCSHPDPVWVYHTRVEIEQTYGHRTYTGRTERRRFSPNWTAETAQQGRPDARMHHRHSTGWAACEPCAVLIELRDMQRLITRVRRVGSDEMRAAPRNVFKEGWGEFFRSISHRKPIDK